MINHILHKLSFYYQLKQLPFQKTDVEQALQNFHQRGITESSRSQQVIVSLTSFPQRIKEVKYVIYSLMTQSVKPDKIILWLAKEQFREQEASLPPDLLALKENGLTIAWCSDILSYKKLVPALSQYPNDIIITADDDLFYPKDWLKSLYQTHLKHLNCIIGHRCHKIKLSHGVPVSYKKWRKNKSACTPSNRNFLTSGAGILYPPHSLYKDICNEHLFSTIAPYADDIWFWGMAVLQGTPIITPKYRMKKLTYINIAREKRQTHETTLAKINLVHNGNNSQMERLLKAYPEIIKKLK